MSLRNGLDFCQSMRGPTQQDQQIRIDNRNAAKLGLDDLQRLYQPHGAKEPAMTIRTGVPDVLEIRASSNLAHILVSILSGNYKKCISCGIPNIYWPSRFKRWNDLKTKVLACKFELLLNWVQSIPHFGARDELRWRHFSTTDTESASNDKWRCYEE